MKAWFASLIWNKKNLVALQELNIWAIVGVQNWLSKGKEMVSKPNEVDTDQKVLDIFGPQEGCQIKIE